jgi:hypothetical protein
VGRLVSCSSLLCVWSGIEHLAQVASVDLDVAVLGQYAMGDLALGTAVTADVRLWILDALCSAEVENTADE